MDVRSNISTVIVDAVSWVACQSDVKTSAEITQLVHVSVTSDATDPHLVTFDTPIHFVIIRSNSRINIYAGGGGTLPGYTDLRLSFSSDRKTLSMNKACAGVTLEIFAALEE